jgi:hypothetical protein
MAASLARMARSANYAPFHYAIISGCRLDLRVQERGSTEIVRTAAVSSIFCVVMARSAGWKC